MYASGDNFLRHLERALTRRLTPPPDALDQDAVRAHVADAYAAALEEAFDSIAVQIHSEAVTRREDAARRAQERAAREAADERDGVARRKRLRRVVGGAEVDLASSYKVYGHPLGSVAFARDFDAEATTSTPTPVVAGTRCTVRFVSGAELADIDLVAVVADHGAARLKLLELAEAARAKAEP